MFTWNIRSLRRRIHIQIQKLRLQRRLCMNIKTSKFFFGQPETEATEVMRFNCFFSITMHIFKDFLAGFSYLI